MTDQTDRLTDAQIEEMIDETFRATEGCTEECVLRQVSHCRQVFNELLALRLLVDRIQLHAKANNEHAPCMHIDWLIRQAREDGGI